MFVSALFVDIISDKLTSSFRTFTSASSLERQEIQIFLFLPLFLESLADRSKRVASSRVHWRNFSLLTLPCFHSSWRGQQHTLVKTIENDNEVRYRGNIHYLHLIYNLIYNLSVIWSTSLDFLSPKQKTI